MSAIGAELPLSLLASETSAMGGKGTLTAEGALDFAGRGSLCSTNYVAWT